MPHGGHDQTRALTAPDLSRHLRSHGGADSRVAAERTQTPPGSVCSPRGHEAPEKSSLCAGEASTSGEQTDIYPLTPWCKVPRSPTEVCPAAGHTDGRDQSSVKQGRWQGRAWAQECGHTQDIGDGGKAVARVDGHLLGLWFPDLAAHWAKRYGCQMSYMLRGVVVIWVHSCVKIHPVIHLRCVYLTVLKHTSKKIEILFCRLDSRAIKSDSNMQAGVKTIVPGGE